MKKEISDELREALDNELALLTAEVEKYASLVVDEYKTNGTEMGGTVTQVSEHSPALEEDPDPKDLPNINAEPDSGNSQEARSFAGGVDWRNSIK
jgi:hypothetical protein